ncbi:MAG: hypothetical protein K6B44_03340 [Lachnospiraceae bacterium]|nr:hypothetical protein [Lachnospiraceae bacterium]
MKKMRCLALLLVLVCVTGLAGCGKKDGGQDTPQAGNNTDSSTVDETETADASDAQTGKKEAIMPGRLYALNLEEGEKAPIKGLILTGNRAGYEINEADTAEENIRCIFELNEYIGIYPAMDSPAASGLKAYITPHSEDPATYVDSFFAKISEDVPVTEFYDLDDTLKGCRICAEMYLNPDIWQSGYYDLVITKSGKPIAFVMLKFFNEGELADKDDEALMKLMDQVIASRK